MFSLKKKNHIYFGNEGDKKNLHNIPHGKEEDCKKPFYAWAHAFKLWFKGNKKIAKK